jgi:GNAT superfamily N-acetyltransferase
VPVDAAAPSREGEAQESEPPGAAQRGTAPVSAGPHIGKLSPPLASVRAMTCRVDTRELVLRGGHIVRVRPLRATDRAIYERAVMDLSPRSRYLRFFAPIPRLSERLLDQMTQIDGCRHVAYIALTADESSAVGVIRYVLSTDNLNEGEVAIAVADDWQRRGLGGQLLGQTVAHAHEAGLDSLTATTLRENASAAGLLQASGFSAVAASGPYAEHRMRLRH